MNHHQLRKLLNSIGEGAPGGRWGKICDGREYTTDEIEFMMAMDRYKREANRPFPTWCEVLRVLRALGYTKQEHP